MVQAAEVVAAETLLTHGIPVGLLPGMAMWMVELDSDQGWGH